MFIFVLAGILIKTSELGTAVTQWKFNIFVLLYNFIGISMTVYTFTKLLLHYHLLEEEMVGKFPFFSMFYILLVIRECYVFS